MIDVEEIVRIAAKGDGVTVTGRHVAGTVPGDRVDQGGSVEPGPHHVTPPCRHFPECGGCQLQHADKAALRQFVTDRVVNAADGQGIAIGALHETHLSPPKTRRRATLHGLRNKGGAVLGFKEQRSNRIIDLRECHVLRPELFALVQPLRELIARFAGRGPVDVSLTLADQGVDCAVTGIENDSLDAAEALRDFAQGRNLARFALDAGFGAEPVWEPQPVTITLGGTPVALPSGAFLQPTEDGQDRLAQDLLGYLKGAGTIADLFSGLGTFAFELASQSKVLAVEGARDAHIACKSAANLKGRPVHAMHRDLFRNPLQPAELDRFDAIALDPPRAGAREQVGQITNSKVRQVAYVSCNPSSWARDAKTLTDAGFELAELRPVGQFRWSTHVELTSLFVR